MKIYISHAGNYDYVSELYEPIKQSEISAQHEIFLPHEPQNVSVAAKDIIAGYDVLVAEVSRPSTGQGIEIGLANAADIPIICFFEKGVQPSSSLKFCAQEIIEYSGADDMLQKLSAKLRHMQSV